MSFFEPPPPPPEPEPDEFAEPEWFGPPRNQLGTSVPLRAVLARTDDVAVAVIDAVAYTHGFEFKVAIRSRRRSSDDFEDPLDFHHPMMWRRWRQMGESGELPPELFRFGVEFADGSKATTLGGHPLVAGPEKRPAGPVLMERGGGGGGGDWNHDLWVWPLPPEGRLAFVCEWPAMGIELTRHEIEAGLIRDAAERAEVLWDDPGGRRASSRYGTFSAYGPAVAAPPSEQADEPPR